MGFFLNSTQNNTIKIVETNKFVNMLSLCNKMHIFYIDKLSFRNHVLKSYFFKKITL